MLTELSINNFKSWKSTGPIRLGRLGSVKEVPLTRSGTSIYDFEEFPDILLSVDIDLSDRKFIAISYANDTDTPIAQASDSKWIGRCIDSFRNYSSFSVQGRAERYLSQKNGLKWILSSFQDPPIYS